MATGELKVGWHVKFHPVRVNKAVLQWWDISVVCVFDGNVFTNNPRTRDPANTGYLVVNAFLHK